VAELGRRLDDLDPERLDDGLHAFRLFSIGKDASRRGAELAEEEQDKVILSASSASLRETLR